MDDEMEETAEVEEDNGSEGECDVRQEEEEQVKNARSRRRTTGRRANRIPWTAREKQALLDGVRAHGRKWKVILDQNTSVYEENCRSNVDLKDCFVRLARERDILPKKKRKLAGLVSQSKFAAASPLSAFSNIFSSLFFSRE
jgi:hypothetical protein